MAGAASGQPLEMEEPPEETEEEEGEPGRPPATLPPDRPLMLRAGGSLTWDSNIFRAPSAREELIGAAYAGLSVDAKYAQQRLRLDVTETAYRYRNFPHLDFNALNYAGAWTWQFTPRIGGALSARRDESLADYSDFRRPGERNVRITENTLASADAWVFGGWHVVGGVSRVENRYSAPFPEAGSYRADGAEGGVRWVARSQNSLALIVRSLDGAYIDRALDPAARIDDGFRRTETEALAAWRITGKSTFEGRAAWIDYRSNNFAERDFSGIAIRLRYVWETTARLAVNASFGREIEPWTEVSASHRVEQRVTLGPVWQPFARTTLRLEASRAESDFRGALPGFAGTPRSDVERRVGLEGEWRAARNLSLKAGALGYRQSSTDPAANFSGSLVTAGFTFLF
jgi:exopolysaccharide biosynthesis operon protein EpsL